MPTGRKIGILTGGGDVPGLNPVIKSVVYRASEMGRDVVGIRRGWQGLTHMNATNVNDPMYIRPLTRDGLPDVKYGIAWIWRGDTRLHFS